MKKNSRVCEVYGKKKVRYPDEYEAGKALEKSKGRSSPAKGWYWHSKCQGFHLTSETQEEYQENRQRYGLVSA